MDILAVYALALASSGMLWKGKKMDLQKEVDAFIQKPAYGLSHAEKSVRYAKMLSAATQYHREKCPEYGRFIRALGCPEGSFFVKEDEAADPAHLECPGTEKAALPAGGTPLPGQEIREENNPFLPVSIFKEMDLRSIPEEEVFKVITSCRS